jgi:hypothetical protein
MTFLPRLIASLILVESGGQPNPPRGDNGLAAGPLQIHACVIADVNESYGTSFCWPQDAENPARARVISSLYIYRWGKRLPNCTPAQAARIWNGGPRGWRKPSTLAYAARVEKALSKQHTPTEVAMLAQDKNVVQVTDMDAPDAIIPESQFGRNISNQFWSEEECSRIRRKGRDAFIKVNGGGRIAVFCKR